MQITFQLNEDQMRLIADLFKDLSLFFFATVIAPLFVEFDKINFSVIFLGLILSIVSFIASLIVLYGINRES